MKQNFIITFAGVQGSSKSPISNHLSYKFNLPVFCNDQLRYEVREDLLVDDIDIPEALAEFKKRQTKIRNEILASGQPVIIDSSVDRTWPTFKNELQRYEYGWFIISLDFSKEFLEALYAKTGRKWAIKELDLWYQQHQTFLSTYNQDVNLHLTDKNFTNRVQICINELKKFIDRS